MLQVLVRCKASKAHELVTCFDKTYLSRNREVDPQEHEVHMP